MNNNHNDKSHPVVEGPVGVLKREMTLESGQESDDVVYKKEKLKVNDKDVVVRRVFCLWGNYRVGWIHDADIPNCMICSAEFGFFNRKHHCRACGNVVCSTCSPYRAAVPSLDDATPPSGPPSGPDMAWQQQSARGSHHHNSGGSRVCATCFGLKIKKSAGGDLSSGSAATGSDIIQKFLLKQAEREQKHGSKYQDDDSNADTCSDYQDDNAAQPRAVRKKEKRLDLEHQQFQLLEEPKYSKAYRRMRSMIPPNIETMNVETLVAAGLPKSIAKRIWSKRSLWLIVMHPDDIKKIHIADLRSKFSPIGLDVIERYAVWYSLPKWEEEVATDFIDINNTNYSNSDKIEWKSNFKTQMDEMARKNNRSELEPHLARHDVYKNHEPIHLFSHRAPIQRKYSVEVTHLFLDKNNKNGSKQQSDSSSVKSLSRGSSLASMDSESMSSFTSPTPTSERSFDNNDHDEDSFSFVSKTNSAGGFFAGDLLDGTNSGLHSHNSSHEDVFLAEISPGSKPRRRSITSHADDSQTEELLKNIRSDMSSSPGGGRLVLQSPDSQTLKREKRVQDRKKRVELQAIRSDLISNEENSNAAAEEVKRRKSLVLDDKMMGFLSAPVIVLESKQEEQQQQQQTEAAQSVGFKTPPHKSSKDANSINVSGALLSSLISDLPKLSATPLRELMSDNTAAQRRNVVEVLEMMRNSDITFSSKEATELLKYTVVNLIDISQDEDADDDRGFAVVGDKEYEDAMVSIIDILVTNCGADINTRDRDGNSLLTFIERYNSKTPCTRLVRTLIYHGIDIMVPNTTLGKSSVKVHSLFFSLSITEKVKLVEDLSSVSSLELSAAQRFIYFALLIVIGRSSVASLLISSLNITPEISSALLRICNFESMEDPIETFELLDSHGAHF